MRKISIIILLIIFVFNISVQAQQVSDEFEVDYEYNSYPGAIIIGAKFINYIDQANQNYYFTVEAFKDDGNYYICLRNVDNQLNPIDEYNYQITDPNFGEIKNLTEFYYNKTEGVEFLVATGKLTYNGVERAFWANFEANYPYTLNSIRILENNPNEDKILEAKGVTRNSFKNDGMINITGAKGYDYAYLLPLLNDIPDVNGIKLTDPNVLSECAIYDVARHPTNTEQYVFVGEYANRQTGMTEILLGRFQFDGQNFSDVSYGGIDIRSAIGQYSIIRARNICFGDNNKIYVAGDFTHGDFTTLNQTLYCTQIYYLEFGQLTQALFNTTFQINSGKLYGIAPSPRIYRTVEDLISRGSSQIPLIVGTSVQYLNSYNETYIYKIGDYFSNHDEAGVLGTWYSDIDQLMILSNFNWKPEFYGFTGYHYVNACKGAQPVTYDVINNVDELWKSKYYGNYSQEYLNVTYSNKLANATMIPLACGVPNINGSTFRKITIPNPNNKLDEIAINMYPNPAIESFSIVVSEHTYNVKLYTYSGELIKEYYNCIGETLIDVSQLSSAIYIAKIITQDEIYEKRIVIN